MVCCEHLVKNGEPITQVTRWHVKRGTSVSKSYSKVTNSRKETTHSKPRIEKLLLRSLVGRNMFGEMSMQSWRNEILLFVNHHIQFSSQLAFTSHMKTPIKLFLITFTEKNCYHLTNYVHHNISSSIIPSWGLWFVLIVLTSIVSKIFLYSDFHPVQWRYHKQVHRLVEII